MEQNPDFLEAYKPEPFALPEMGVGERLVNAVGLMPKRLLANATNIARTFAGQPRMDFPEDSVPPPATGGQVAAEIGGHLLPMLAELYATGKVSGAALSGLGVTSPLMRRTVQDALGFGVIGAAEGPEVGLEQVAEGAGYGLSTGLSRTARVIPLAGLAYGSKLFFDAHNPEPVIQSEKYGDFTQGDLSAGLGFGLGMLPGKIPARIATVANQVSPLNEIPLRDRQQPFLLEDRAIEGQIIDDSLPRLEGGPGSIYGDTIRAGGPAPQPELQRALPRYPRRYTDPLELGYEPHPFTGLPEDTRASMEQLRQGIPPTGQAVAPEFHYINNLWGTKGMEVADDVMEEFLQSLQIANAPRAALDRAFAQIGADNATKMRMIWNMMRDAEASMNPQQGKLGVSEAEKIMLQFVADRNRRNADVGFLNERTQRPLLPQNPEADFNPQLGRLDPIDPSLRPAREAAFPLDPMQTPPRPVTPEYIIPNEPIQAKSKLHSLPEWMRTEGGATDLTTLGPIARVALGGLGGYAVGGEEGAALGASMGLAPELARIAMGIAQKYTKPIHAQNAEGAVRVNKKLTPDGALQPLQKPVIVSTAIQREGKLYRGKEWNTPHNGVGMNNLDNFPELLEGKNVPQNERGFIVREADGREWFTTDRNEAARIAKDAGQSNVDSNLQSEDLVTAPSKLRPLGEAQDNKGAIDIGGSGEKKTFKSDGDIIGSAREMFDEKAFKGIEGAKSRSKIVDMVIDDFQKLHHPIPLSIRRTGAEDAAKAGIKWKSLPQLLIEDGKVVSVEGRHRAEYLKSKGYKTMPVEIRDRIIRWDETDPKQYPKTLKAEGRLSDEIPFPVKSNLQPLQSGLSPLNTFAKTLAERVETRVKGKVEGQWTANLAPGDIITSNSSGRKYEFVKNWATHKQEGQPEVPMIRLKDIFSGEESNYMVYKDGKRFWTKVDGTDVTADPPKLRPLDDTNEGGFIFPGLQAAVGRGAIGGIVGGAYTSAQDGDFATGAMYGALLTMFGPAAAREILSGFASLRSIKLKGKDSVLKQAENIAKNFGREVERKSGAAFMSSATPADRFVRWLDTKLDITLAPAIKNALLNSRGVSGHLVDMLDNALNHISLRYSPSDLIKNVSNTYLDNAKAPGALQTFLAAVRQIDTSPQAMKYAQMVVTARESITGLQRMVSEGIGDAKMASIINNSLDQYMTKSYKLFVDPKWKPDAHQIDAVVREIIGAKLWKGAEPEQIRAHLEQYIREVKTKTGIYRGSVFSSKIGQIVGQSALMRRTKLSPEWREFLGEITDPLERISQTIFKVRPMAEASGYFARIANTVREDGWLPHYFDNYASMSNFRQNLLQETKRHVAGTPDYLAAKEKLDKFDLKWQGAQDVENHPKFGSLRNGIVTRNVWDTLRTFDSWTDSVNSPLLRSIAGLHTSIKIGRTALSPITSVRNFLTAPMFAFIAKVDVGLVPEAHRILSDINHPMRKEIMHQGIGNVDQVKTEFYKEFENIMGGKYKFGTLDGTKHGLGIVDFDLAERAARRGLKNILNLYRYPDNLIRVSAYISAKARFADELGKKLDDPEVIRKATDFTNRYTMNYDAVSPAVKQMRQLPFFNLFISYTAEMIRILKNLTADLLKGSDGVSHNRMYAAGPLAMIAIVPSMLQDSAEDSLSPKDRQDWENAKKLMPYYAKNRYFIDIQRDPKTKQFTYKDMSPLVVSDSLNTMVRAISDGDFATAAKINPLIGLDNTPMLNIVSSQIAGKDLRSFREFRDPGKFTLDNANDRIATIAKEVLPPWTPGVGFEWKRGVQAHTLNEHGERGVTNLKTGNRLTPSDFWMPFWTGIKSGGVNLSVLQKRKVSEYKREIANETAYLNDILKSDINNEAKQEAIQKFRLVIAEIQEASRRVFEEEPARK